VLLNIVSIKQLDAMLLLESLELAGRDKGAVCPGMAILN